MTKQQEMSAARSELDRELSKSAEDASDQFESLKAMMGHMSVMERPQAIFITLPACNSEN
jgi:arsenate reductase-like glutaredoxin family protein